LLLCAKDSLCHVILKLAVQRESDQLASVSFAS
jgi:hypothetical protein